MKAIIYCRVSTVEQAQKGYSLEAQERECTKFAENQGFEAEKIFIERGESAKTTDRTELQKLIKYSVENKKSLDALIIWKYDRLARNLSDQTELVKHFSSLGIRVLSVTENNEDNSVGRLMRNIIGSFAQYENDIRAERTISGMKQALKEGRWCWKPPLGYKSIKDGNKKCIVPTDESQFIVEAFEMMGTSLYKQTDVLSCLRKKGLNGLSKSSLNRILRNPLYAGLIRVEWLPDYVDALHKPIISRDIFFKVQAILDGKRPVVVPRPRNNADFPLRNFIRCERCGSKLTGSWSKGRNKKYAYYHCRGKGCSMNIRKEVLEAVFYEYLQSFQPKEEILDLFGAIVLDVWEKQQEERFKEQKRMERELDSLKQKKDRIFDLLLKKTIDDETYKFKMEEIAVEITTKEIELNEIKIDLNDVESCINYCKFFLSNIARLWHDSPLDLRQRFQNLIFPEGIAFDGENFRTAVTANIFRHLQPERVQKYSLVAPTGFEPVSDG